jgi:hypothetical protein
MSLFQWSDYLFKVLDRNVKCFGGVTDGHGALPVVAGQFEKQPGTAPCLGRKFHVF